MLRRRLYGEWIVVMLIAAAIAAEAARRGISIELVRNGSRGAFWLEPMVEVQTPAGRMAYGPVQPTDVAGLFDAGFTTKDRGRGTGLGLSISYNIIKDFGGSLTVGPRDGGGALFRIELLEAEALNEAAE